MELSLSWEGLGAMMVASVYHGHLPLVGIPGLLLLWIGCSPAGLCPAALSFAVISRYTPSPGQTGVAK